MSGERTQELSAEDTRKRRKKTIWIVVIILALIMLIGGGGFYYYYKNIYPQKLIENLRSEASQAFESKDYSLALEDYTKLSDYTSLYNNEMENMAICYIETGNITEARNTYQDLYIASNDSKYLMMAYTVNTGNYSGNLANHGQMVEDVENSKVYIANFSPDSGGIISEFDLGAASGKEILNLNQASAGISDMNIVDGYLYYIIQLGYLTAGNIHGGVYRIPLGQENPTPETILTRADNSVSDYTNMTSIGNILYMYRKQSDNNGYELISLNGDGVVDVLRENITPVALVSDGINLYGIDNNEVFKMTPEGDYETLETLTTIPQDYSLIVVNDTLYYITTNSDLDSSTYTISSLSIDGGTSEELYSDTGYNVVFNIFDENLYCSKRTEMVYVGDPDNRAIIDRIDLYSGTLTKLINVASDPEVYGHTSFNDIQTHTAIGDIMVTQNNLYYREYELDTPRGLDFNLQGFYISNYDGTDITLMDD